MYMCQLTRLECVDGRKELNVGLCIEVLLRAEWVLKILACFFIEVLVGAKWVYC